jgi:hypothetical protein
VRVITPSRSNRKASKLARSILTVSREVTSVVSLSVMMGSPDVGRNSLQTSPSRHRRGGNACPTAVVAGVDQPSGMRSSLHQGPANIASWSGSTTIIFSTSGWSYAREA